MKKILIAILVMIFLSAAVYATEHLIPLQGRASDTFGIPLSTGDISVRVYNASTGGTLVYDSGTDFNDTIQDGIYDVLLGSITTLDLDNTKKYFMEIDINGEEVVGDATSGRQAFWPSSGDHAHLHDLIWDAINLLYNFINNIWNSINSLQNQVADIDLRLKTLEGSTCTPQTEICDGLDNNCDGQADDGNPGGGASCDTGLTGVCSAGTRTCQSGALQCIPDTLPSLELCDSLDNDCDGQVDDGCVMLSCSDADSDTYSAIDILCPGGNDCDDNDASINPGAIEICDGVDNDCDGVIDEGFDLNTDENNCGYCGNACAPTDNCIQGVCTSECILGDTRACEITNVYGTCTGIETCDGGEWGSCSAPTPQAEVCDSVDNNCDGQVDEDYFPQLGQACGVGACAGGTIVCSLDGLTTECNTDNLASAEVCDGIDNDCDGEVDEGGDAFCDDGNPCTNDVCGGSSGCIFTNNDGTNCDDGDACTTNDMCSAGVCEGGAPAICDDDNPCTDDSCNPGFGCSNTPNDGAVCNDANACTENDYCATGECIGGYQTDCNDGVACTIDSCNPSTGCENSPNQGACEDGLACTTDTCDVIYGGCQSLINAGNCLIGGSCYSDGYPDPSNQCQKCDSSASLTSWSFEADGTNCNDGNPNTINDVCAAGVCVGEPVDADGDGYTSDVDCDDSDATEFPGQVWYADCDGDTFERSTAVTSCDVAGADASTPCTDALPPDGGWSHTAGNDCNDEDYLVYPGAAEVCDSVDNNCINGIDEGFPIGGACGVGACAGGTIVCSSDGLTTECNTDNLASAEVCDSIDNDCDGVVDEGDPGGGGACDTGLAGVCKDGTQMCLAGMLQCVQDTSSSPEVCDGIDNDCDGAVDDGFDLNTDVNNCGACDRACSNINVNTLSCNNGVCDSTCNEGYSNCEMPGAPTPDDGCELQLSGYSNDFGTAEYVGSKAGDLLCGFPLCESTNWQFASAHTGTRGKFFRYTALETSACTADIAARLTLSVPAGVDYDLYAYDSASNLLGSSILSGSSTEQIIVSNGDSGGADDSFDIIIEVRYFSGSSCSSWSLTFDGRYC